MAATTVILEIFVGGTTWQYKFKFSGKLINFCRLISTKISIPTKISRIMVFHFTQASDSKSNAKARELFLPLAERLIDKYFADNDVDSEAEVRLYLMVLDRLHKMEKKLSVLDDLPGREVVGDDFFTTFGSKVVTAT